MTSMVDLVPINVKTPRIYNEYYLEKKFIKLICMNQKIILYLNVNQVTSCNDLSVVLRLKTQRTFCG